MADVKGVTGEFAGKRMIEKLATESILIISFKG